MTELWLLAFILILFRTAAFVAVLPVFSGHHLPRMVTMGLAVSLASLWLGRFGTSPDRLLVEMAENPHWLRFAVAVFQEVVMGAVLGFAFSLFLLPARLAGTYIGQEIGLTMATISDPAAPNINVVSQLFETTAILLFYLFDMHIVLLGTLHSTFARFPVGGNHFRPTAVSVAQGVSVAHQHGMLLAAPVGICLFVTLIVVLLMTRASPQLNLFSVGIALRLLVGLGALAIFFPEMASLMRHVLNQMHGLMGRLL